MSRRLAQGVDASPSARNTPPIRAVVALGANLGDRERTLREAADELSRLPLVTTVRVAQAIESVAVTAAGEDPDEPAYLNTVAVLETTLAPSVLLEMLHMIEARHGRERRVRWGARTLDLDLITYGDVRSQSEALLLPHPRAAERDFVLEPWLRVDPDAELPGVGRVDAALAALRAGRGEASIREEAAE